MSLQLAIRQVEDLLENAMVIALEGIEEEEDSVGINLQNILGFRV